ncbi:hypothetical protein O3M35_011603 [Rhynocoris fuscipes]|uniref:Transmembrane protein 223 n=1 Tax=Rhynocoris fuscipes TaxID=488301 RepID=A0AAW1CWU2_9HEMI
MMLRICNALKNERFLQILKPKITFRYSSSLLNVNSNVAKDVILFKYENPTYYKYLNLFGITQFGFWMYLSHFTFTSLRDVPVQKDDTKKLAWYERINLGENKYKNTIAVCCAVIGYLMLVASWTFTLKSVRYLILRKGGKTLSFVTYTPFGKNRIMDVPINKVSAKESRLNAKVQLPIKVEGKYLHYMLDMRGEFTNKQLFDATAGLNRRFT